MALILDAAAASGKGLVRTNNEDNFFLNGLYMDEAMRDEGGVFVTRCKNAGQIYAVCDGMGGEAAGETASLCAVRALAGLARFPLHLYPLSAVRSCLKSASSAIVREGRALQALCGTTAVLAVFGRHAMRFVHLGDSRAYRLENGKLERMTKDHSVVQELIDAGEITEGERLSHPLGAQITRFLGMPPEISPLTPGVSARLPIRTGMKYLLCSDGLTDLVADEQIRDILSENTSAEEAADRLLGAAMKNGGTDNITCLCLFVQSAPSFRPFPLWPRLLAAVLIFLLLIGIPL